MEPCAVQRFRITRLQAYHIKFLERFYGHDVALVRLLKYLKPKA